MRSGSEDNKCQELSPPLPFIRSAVEVIWAHWGPWQDASVGTPTPEPHPLAERWNTPYRTDGYFFRTRVTNQPLRAGSFSCELRTYAPCETLVWAPDPVPPQWRILGESQASPLCLLPRDQPFRLATFRCTEPDSYAQRGRVQQQIGAQLEAVLLHNLWGEDLSQERIAQLSQSRSA